MIHAPRRVLSLFMTRITFPRQDAASKEQGSFKVTLTPATTSLLFGGGKYAVSSSNSKSAKNWLTAWFRLTIPGLDTSKVSAVETIDITIPLVISTDDAACILCVPVPPRISFPQLLITGAESTAATWYSWFQSFVIRGINGDADEKTGTLEYLDSMGAALFSLSFNGLGIISIAPEPYRSGESAARVQAAMYAEKMTISKSP